MTDIVKTESTPDTEVRSFANQEAALLVRGISPRTLADADKTLTDEQVVLLTRMRDNGSKVCVASLPVAGTDEPDSLNAFLSARLSPGRALRWRLSARGAACAGRARRDARSFCAAWHSRWSGANRCVRRARRSKRAP